MRVLVAANGGTGEAVLGALAKTSFELEISASAGACVEELKKELYAACLVDRSLLFQAGPDVVHTMRTLQPSLTVLLYATPDVDPASLSSLGLDAGVDQTLEKTHSLEDEIRAAVSSRKDRSRGRTRSDERRVLVVDDDEDILLPAVSQILRRSRFTVFSAASGREALGILRQEDVHVLLADMVMPEMNGQELIAAALRFDPSIVPVVMTGYPSLEYAISSLRQGTRDFLLKPAQPKQVSGVVERAWGHWFTAESHRQLLQRPADEDEAEKRIHILLVAAQDTKIGDLLQESAGPFSVTTAESCAEGIRHLTLNQPDLILADLNLPDSQGLLTFTQLQEHADNRPILLLTDDESLGHQAVQLGAQDAFVKSNLNAEILVPRILYAADRERLLKKLEQFAQDIHASDASRRTIIDRHADAIIVVGEKGKILFVNPAAESLFFQKAQELVGAPFTFPTVVGTESEIEIRRRDKQIKKAEMHVRQTQWNGEASHLVTLRDITDKKTAEDLQQRLIHADRLVAIGQLAAGVAHEINNPAAFVITNLSAMREHVLSWGAFAAELNELVTQETDPVRRGTLEGLLSRYDLAFLQRDSLESIRDNMEGMDRIRSIVKDLRTFSRIEREEIGLVQINEVVDVACTMVYNEIRHRARLVKDLGRVPMISADRGKLTQVLMNLLVNAAQAITEGAADKNQVKVSTRLYEGEVLLTVEDTGFGIPENVRDRIFEPFFTTKSPEQGTGLGLSLSLEIVRKHGGEIRFTSTTGKGTRFEVALPVKSASDVPTVKEVLPEKRAPHKAHILLIDDEPMILNSYRRMLAPPHDVRLVGGGAEALELLSSDSAFDLVLCDLMMPDVDGPTVYEEVKKSAPHLVARTVFCSGGAFTQRMKDFVSSLPNGVLEKPVMKEKLKELIEEMSR